MATEFEKALVTNMDLNSLLMAMGERDDIDKLVSMLRSNREHAPRDYKSIKEFAEYLGCGVSHIRDLIRKAEANNLFEIYRNGTVIKIDRLSFESWRHEEQLRRAL